MYLRKSVILAGKSNSSRHSTRMGFGKNHVVTETSYQMLFGDVFLEKDVGRSISFCLLAKVASGNRTPAS